MTNDLVQVLKKAKKLISSRKRWCQDVFARTKKGYLTNSRSSNAVAWCAVGACRRAARGRTVLAYYAERTLNKVCRGHSIMALNDGHRSDSHSRVMRAFDRAIKYAAEKRGI